MTGSVAERLLHFTGRKLESAIRQFGMIRDGDRIAVGVSGGKDSLALLRLLAERRRIRPERFDLVAVHVRGDARGPAETPRHEPLERWLDSERIESRIVDLRLAASETLPLSCARCARARRRTLFEAAAALDCNRVALGHHADDLVQTWMMNVLYHGRSEGLEPVRSYFGGRLTLIRPMTLIPEAEIVRLARASGFPPPPPECPAASRSRRQTVRDIVRSAEKRGRQVRSNLIRAALASIHPAGGKGPAAR